VTPERKGTVPLDVQVARERQRRKRLRRVAFVLAPLAVWLWVRLLTGNPVSPGWPDLPPEAAVWIPLVAIVLLLGGLMVLPMVSNGRSPETVFLPEQIGGELRRRPRLGPVVGEVRHTLEVFLNHQQFRDRMGGQPRRGILFEGPPAPARPTPPRQWPRRRGCPSSSSPRPRSRACGTAPPPARSAPTSGGCARSPASKAGRSVSSRSSTPSAPAGAA